MADSAFKTQVSKDENANAVTNQLFVSLTDGTNGVTVTGNALDVNATVTLETAYVDDAAFSIGVDKVNAQGFLADETATDSVDEGDIGLARMTLDRRMITSSEQSGTWNIGTVTTLTGITNDVNIADGGNSITVDAVDLDIRALDHVTIGDSVRVGDGTEILLVNADGSINVVVAGASGTPVHDYATATPAAGASANNDYTVVGTTFNLERVEWAGSGKMKVEIQTGPVAGLVTVAVGFSEKDTNSYIEFEPAKVVPVTSTGTVRVIMTNRQGAAVDVNSTIMGVDVA